MLLPVSKRVSGELPPPPPISLPSLPPDQRLPFPLEDNDNTKGCSLSSPSLMADGGIQETKHSSLMEPKSSGKELIVRTDESITRRNTQSNTIAARWTRCSRVSFVYSFTCVERIFWPGEVPGRLRHATTLHGATACSSANSELLSNELRKAEGMCFFLVVLCGRLVIII